MKLDEYLFRQRVSVKDFSTLIGFQPEYVSSIKTGHKSPGRKMREAVYKVTNGQVIFDMPKKKHAKKEKNIGKIESPSLMRLPLLDIQASETQDQPGSQG